MIDRDEFKSVGTVQCQSNRFANPLSFLIDVTDHYMSVSHVNPYLAVARQLRQKLLRDLVHDGLGCVRVPHILQLAKWSGAVVNSVSQCDMGMNGKECFAD